MPERCVHDLLPGQCAPCAGQELVTPYRPPARALAVLPARYPGWCPGCGGEIEPGDPIVRDADGVRYVHEECG